MVRETERGDLYVYRQRERETLMRKKKFQVNMY